MSEYTEPQGWEVGDGWMPLVKEVHTKLKHLDPNYTILQIKEKFGGLRYYFSPSPDCPEVVRDIMLDVTNVAEHRSTYLCELCGKHGELRDGGWYKTLCNEHHEEREVKAIASKKPGLADLSGLPEEDFL
jgi:hypothetical protein